MTSHTPSKSEEFREFDQAYSRLVDGAKHARPLGLSTGLEEIDRVLGGLRPGSLTMLTGGRVVGKSALAMNIAVNVATEGGTADGPHRVCMLSLDDDREACQERILCVEARCISQNIKRGCISQHDVQKLAEAKQTLAHASLNVIGHPFPGTDWIRSILRSEVNESGVELFILDAAQRIHLSDGKYPQLDDDLRLIKNEIRDLDVPMLVLSDLCQPEDTKGSSSACTYLCDLGVFGDIIPHVDAIFSMHRPCRDIDAPDHDDRLLTNLRVLKNRYGPTGWAQLNFEEEFSTFTDRQRGPDVF